MKKVVLQLHLHCDKEKQKAMRAVSGLTGIESISMDMKDKKMTVIGDVDPVCVARKLRKWCAEILTFGLAKEEKKVEPKKEDNQKKECDPIAENFRACYAYNHHMPSYYCVVRDEGYPNSCIIC